MFNALKQLFSTPPETTHAHHVYVSLVERAREPFFYTDFNVADTLDGRFDVIALHVFLFHFVAKHKEDESLMLVSQAVVDALIKDMDHNLRELGVGDTSLSKKVEKMAYALNGRIQTYEKSWEEPGALAAALTRNVYRSAEPVEQAEALVEYAKQMVAHLSALSVDDLQQGKLQWPEGSTASRAA